MSKNEIEPGGRPVECDDGVWRWAYGLDMIRNPVIFLTVVKVLLFSALVVLGTFVVFGLFGNGFDVPELIRGFVEATDGDDFKYALIALAVFVGVVVFSYFVVATQYGGKYVVLFEMGDTEIRHVQTSEQFEKGSRIGKATAVMGILGGKPSVAGLGISTSVRNSTTSTYVNVRKIKAIRRLNVIFLKEGLTRNQIYVGDEDFDFVLNYLKERCPNAR